MGTGCTLHEINQLEVTKQRRVSEAMQFSRICCTSLRQGMQTHAGKPQGYVLQVGNSVGHEAGVIARNGYTGR